jgi:hypothetical protein
MQVQVELTYMCQGGKMALVYIPTPLPFISPHFARRPTVPPRLKQDEQHIPRLGGCSPILLLGQDTLRSWITVHGVRPSSSAHRTTLLYCV